MKKPNCQWCGVPIPTTDKYNTDYGNSCVTCCIRVGKIVDGVRGVAKGNLGYKIRDYTQEEKDKMLMDRLEEVLNN